MVGALAFVAITSNAQNLSTVKATRGSLSEMKASKKSPEKLVEGSLVCNTQYVAGSTMDLNFSVTFSNTDAEYCDLFTLTFPTGITPNSSPNDPFASDAADAGPDGPEALNPVAGQVISWGNDDNNWGGIITGGATYNFTVNVTIAGGVTGNQTATFDASGDGYGSAPGDLMGGTTTIYPAGAPDVTAKLATVAGLTSVQNCGFSTVTLTTRVANLSSLPASNIPVKYSVNGGTPVAAVIAGPIAAGDSIDYTFTTTANTSAQDVYFIESWTELSGDVQAVNDTASVAFVNSVTVPLTSTIYNNPLETTYDYYSAKSTGTSAAFAFPGATFHGGAAAIYLTVPAGAPAATYESHFILPCMNVVSGEKYRVSYWRKANTPATGAANGQSGIFVGTSQAQASMTTTIKAYSAITPNAQAGAWEKDSALYVATATGTVYFSIGGKGTIVGATDVVNVRIDDIKIERINDLGLNENVSNVSVYPNPTENELNVELNTVATSVSVIGMDGKVISTKNVNASSFTVDVNALTSGVYLYEIVSENGTVTRSTFVKK